MTDEDKPKPPRKTVHPQIASVTSIRRNPKTATGKTKLPQQGAPTSPRTIAVTERRTRVLQMRRAGLTWQLIADRMARLAAAGDIPPLPKGYDKREAQHDAMFLIDEIKVEAAEGMLAFELDLLLAMQTPVYTQAMQGSLPAVDRMLRIMDRRARYLGLDAPTKLVGADGGPLQIQAIMDDPGELQRAAIERLDELLPHEEPPALEGSS